jgi:hypothetical protein
MTRSGETHHRASEVMHGPLFQAPPSASPCITLPPHNHAGSGSENGPVMRDASPRVCISASPMHSERRPDASPCITPSKPVPDALSAALDAARGDE